MRWDRLAERSGRRTGLSVLAALICLLVALGPTRAAEIPAPKSPFSAAMRMHSTAARMVGRLWYDKGLERREMAVEGQVVTFIVRPDRERVYMLQGRARIAVEMALSPELRYMDKQALARLNPQEVGRDSVSGEATRRYSIDGVTLTGQRMVGHTWITDDGIVMKLEGRALIEGQWQDVRMVLEDLRRGPVDAALFEVPEGYQIMQRP